MYVVYSSLQSTSFKHASCSAQYSLDSPTLAIYLLFFCYTNLQETKAKKKKKKKEKKESKKKKKKKI